VALLRFVQFAMGDCFAAHHTFSLGISAFAIDCLRL
jgi:hypothetical protein